MEQRVKLYGLMCPQCGGSLSFKEGANIINCQYCDSSLLVKFKEGLLEYYVPSVITRKRAIDEVKQLFNHKEAAGELHSAAVLSDITLYYIPYWRFKTAVFGSVEGVETVDRRHLLLPQAEEGSYAYDYVQKFVEPSVRRSVSKKVRNIMIVNISASNMSDTGIPNLNSYRQRSSTMTIFKRMDQFSSVGLLRKSEIKNAVIVDRMYSQEIAEAEADTIITQFIETRGSGLDHYTATLRELRRRVFLIYYPVWLCKFKFQGRFYRATIDGLSGKIISAVLPQQQKGRILGILGISLLLSGTISAVLRGIIFGGKLAKDILSYPLSWGVIVVILIVLGSLAKVALKVFYEERDFTIEG